MANSLTFSVKQIKAKLQGYGVPAENLDSATEDLCAAHKTDLDAIIEERDTYKATAETLAGAKEELDKLKAAGDGGLADLQTKYAALEKEHKAALKEHERYKADQTAKETYAAKEKAYRAILKAANINEKRYDTILRAAKADGIIDSIELDENGGAKDADKLAETVKTDWADFVLTTETTGANIAHPPVNVGGNAKPTKEEIDNIKDPGERVRAIAQNLDLYGAS